MRALLLLLTALATVPAQAQIHREPDEVATLPAVVADRTDGALIAAVRTVGSTPRLVLEREETDGRARWTYVADHDGQVSSITPMPDGSWLVAGQYRLPDPHTTTSGFLLVLEDDGRLRWHVAPSARWVGFDAAVSTEGRIFVAGRFFRGAVRLPGGPRWRTARRFGAFLTELDAANGTVRWGHPITLGDEDAAIAVTTDGVVAIATHRRRLRGGEDALLSTFTGRGAPIDQRTFTFGDSTFARALRPLPGGGLAMVTSTEVTGARTARLAIFASPSADPTWVVLPSEAQLVATSSPDAPLETFAPGRHVGIAEDHQPLVSGLTLQAFEPTSGALTSERWVGVDGPLTIGSLHVAHGAQTWVSFASRASAGFALVVAPADALRTSVDPGDYAIADHVAALARETTVAELF